jgi:hypothetical protein
MELLHASLQSEDPENTKSALELGAQQQLAKNEGYADKSCEFSTDENNLNT